MTPLVLLLFNIQFRLYTQMKETSTCTMYRSTEEKQYKWGLGNVVSRDCKGRLEEKNKGKECESIVHVSALLGSIL